MSTQRGAALLTSMVPAKDFDFSAGCDGQEASQWPGHPEADGQAFASSLGAAKQRYAVIPDPTACSTSATLPLFPQSGSRFNTEESLPDWLEMEAVLLQARGQLETSELSAAAACGDARKRFEFPAPPFFEESFEEQEEYIDGCQQDAVFCDVAAGDVGVARRQPAGFGPALEMHLLGGLRALRRSRFQRILTREDDESLDSAPACPDCAPFASGSAAKALKQFRPRSPQEPEPTSPADGASSGRRGEGVLAPQAAALAPLMPQAPTGKRPSGRGRRPGRQPTTSSSSGSEDAEQVL